MAAYSIDHVHIYSGNVENTVSFYIQAFGATEIRRVNESMVHLDLNGTRIVVSQSSDANPAGIGHFAVNADDLQSAIAELSSLQVDVGNIRTVSRFRNVFIKDPNGVAIEIISPSTKKEAAV